MQLPGCCAMLLFWFVLSYATGLVSSAANVRLKCTEKLKTNKNNLSPIWYVNVSTIMKSYLQYVSDAK